MLTLAGLAALMCEHHCSSQGEGQQCGGLAVWFCSTFALLQPGPEGAHRVLPGEPPESLAPNRKQSLTLHVDGASLPTNSGSHRAGQHILSFP